MKKRTFIAENINQEIRFKPLDSIKLYLLNMPTEITVTIDKLRGKRSIQQNRYYFGVPIKLIAEHTGYTKDETHELLKYKFLTETIWLEGKATQVITVTKSTTDLTTVEMEEYLSEIRQWASLELSCYVPEPNETEYAYE